MSFPGNSASLWCSSVVGTRSDNNYSLVTELVNYWFNLLQHTTIIQACFHPYTLLQCYILPCILCSELHQYWGTDHEKPTLLGWPLCTDGGQLYPKQVFWAMARDPRVARGSISRTSWKRTSREETLTQLAGKYWLRSGASLCRVSGIMLTCCSSNWLSAV